MADVNEKQQLMNGRTSSESYISHLRFSKKNKNKKNNIKTEYSPKKCHLSLFVIAEFSHFLVQLLLSFVPWTLFVFVSILHMFAIFAHYELTNGDREIAIRYILHLCNLFIVTRIVKS